MPARSSTKLNNPSYSSKAIQSSVVHGRSTGFEFARVLRSISVQVQRAAFEARGYARLRSRRCFHFPIKYLQVALNPTLGASELDGGVLSSCKHAKATQRKFLKGGGMYHFQNSVLALCKS